MLLGATIELTRISYIYVFQVANYLNFKTKINTICLKVQTNTSKTKINLEEKRVKKW
jgi:hypothetical protein